MTPITYRPDIDGLRALAVLSVVLFHYQLGPVPGGFVGVDVFFVISGYLITAIIAGEIGRGSFSFTGFYDRRVRRILPAALVVVLASLVAGYFILLPTAYTTLGASAGYSAAGLANFYFLWNTGYFDASAEMQPMLHMWSLAVEEQFYLVWPVILLVVARLSSNSPRIIAGALAAIILASFATSVAILEVGDPKIGFYMLHSRAWELALGALLVFLPRIPGRVFAEVLSLLGLGLVVAAFFLLDAESKFPGANAAYPVVGAALLVWPREQGTWIARLLALPPLVFIGRISFSLYLYHWPVLVFYRLYGTGEQPGTREALWLALASLVLAVLSWRFIEQPFRRRRGRKGVNVAVGSTAIVAVAACGLAVATSGGLPARLPPELRKLEHYAAETVTSQNGRNDCFITSLHKRGVRDFSEDECVDIRPGRRNVLLVGDSHAAHYGKALRDVYPEVEFSQVTASGCRPVVQSPDAKKNTCTRLLDKVFSEYIPRGDFDAVILAGRWSAGNSARLAKTVEQIAPQVGEVIVFGPVPEYTSELPVLLARSALRKDNGALVDEARLYAQAEKATQAVSGRMQPLGVSFYAPFDAMCEQGRCVATTAAGVPVQFDKAHLSYEGARLVIERFRSQGLLASGAAAPAGASQRPAATAQPAASRK
ncbi:acyltransferase family protein [Luteimonas arsenica]|uniref:acyltransferase family protein n=1 Tax=Luteimonas arsenica TaxID=1586242 RepID=UPI001054BCEE|nr:acyltransferase family protein [Luteimonas arsenica]